MSLSPIQDGCDVRSDGKELKDVSADEPINTSLDSKIRANSKKHYYEVQESILGADLKYYWKSDCLMIQIADLMPMIHNPLSLQHLCNKSTMLYYELSARMSDGKTCPPIIFPCIYKCWFRYHGNTPDMEFGNKFFTHPFQITPTGPQTIPQIVNAHAHLCDQAASHLKSIKNADAGSHWQRFQLLPLCRAIIVLLDECPLPLVHKPDGTVSLDDEVQRLSAVLVLTGYDQDLSAAINFDTIRSDSRSLARQDVSRADSKNVIRVSLKTAVQFIEGLQQREDRANGIGETGDKADEYVNDILDDPEKSEKKRSVISLAVDRIRAKERGEELYEGVFTHWRGNWI